MDYPGYSQSQQCGAESSNESGGMSRSFPYYVQCFLFLLFKPAVLVSCTRVKRSVKYHCPSYY
ncbi:hypothetical protein BDV27DRAFT_122825 [Aspergillus caelatus]|uniref:Uncharacterized protein n=1 Tax=Aspergillus caelatus TaxID=61420 RepID=A0A5N7AG26_9EURO|nr:uncharacterized protein BDV27DRAFT_122825 [Aspergillus caelatus]KAE8368126.1 hypothetical protein BDV27DRAFT_122825 [Aspergillus caelatus]